jgi:hypothetical protein
MMDVAETAKSALEILDEHGWCRGLLTNGPYWVDGRYPEGSHCIGGAWNLAFHGTHEWSCDLTAYRMLAQVIHDQHPGRGSYHEEDQMSVTHFIATWNNDENTAEADVRAILEKLAAS